MKKVEVESAEKDIICLKRMSHDSQRVSHQANRNEPGSECNQMAEQSVQGH